MAPHRPGSSCSASPHRAALGARVLLAAASVSAALGGCGGDRQATPRAAAEASIEAMIRGDVDLTIALTPTPELLRAALDCPEGRQNLATQLDDDALRIPERVRLTREAMAGVKAKLQAFDLAGAEDLRLPVGEEFRGCTIKEALVLHRSPIIVRFTKAGRIQDDQQTMNFIELEGRWYVLP